MEEIVQSLPLVSIITVTKNLVEADREDYFCQCVESIRMQNYSNIEHLVIDGASTDGTLELLKKMGVRYISEPDKGIYDACNKGIRLAKGKYIAFVTSDDYYISPHAISTAVNILEKINGDISYAPIILEYKDKIEISQPYFSSFFRGCPFGIPAGLFKKQLYDKFGFLDEHYKIAADYKLIMQAIISGKKIVESSKNPMVVMRCQGFSNSNAQKLREENIQIIKELLNIDYKTAVKANKYGFLPTKKILEILKKIDDFPNEDALLKNNRRNFFKYIRKQLFSFRTRKGKRCFRLLGITFYNEDKL